MLRAFSTAATGMTGQQMMVDVIANNLANVNTTGYKRSQVNFQDLLYVSMREPGTEVSAGFKSPGGIEIGSGVRVVSTTKVFTPGELQNTGHALDIAISGDSFLQITMPNGDIRYTRDGSLQINANGQLVTTNGYTIEPAISIPIDAVAVTCWDDTLKVGRVRSSRRRASGQPVPAVVVATHPVWRVDPTQPKCGWGNVHVVDGVRQAASASLVAGMQAADDEWNANRLFPGGSLFELTV